MGKKKYLIIIAAIIFIFLAIFAFANPLKQDKKVDAEVEENKKDKETEKDQEEVEENKKDKETEKDQEEVEETKPVVGPIYNNHGVTIDKETTIEDKSFEIAEEAVEKAEITLSIEDLDKALKLIEKVKNEDERKELEERVEAIIETLNLTDLVNTLVETVKAAESKADLEQTRKLLSQEDLVKRVDNLSNEVIKKLLGDKLTTVLPTLEDTTDPSVNIEDEAILNEEVEIIVTDESEVTIILNEEAIENNKVVSDGKYTLTVTDASFNTITIEFTIDTIAPEFIIGEESIGNGEYYSKLDLTLVDENLKYLEINGVGDNAISPFEIPSEYYVKGENVLVATDIAGNETTFTFNYIETVEVLEQNKVLEPTEKLQIAEGETYVLDLNNNIYTVDNEGSSRNIINRGTLIITNGKMVNSATGWNFGLIDNYGTLVVDGVEFTDNGEGFGSTIKNRGGEVTVTNSKFINTGEEDGNAGIYSDGKLNIENTTFVSSSKDSYPLRVNSGEATIKNVEVDGTNGALCINSGDVVVENLEYKASYKYYGIYIANDPESYAGSESVIDNVNVTIKGGKFIGKDYALCIEVTANEDESDVNVTIEDGLFEGPISAIYTVGGTEKNTMNLQILGGKFSSDVTSYLDTTEYEAILNVETGYYEVNKKNA